MKPWQSHWFGVPGQGKRVRIGVEINTPLSGRNDRLAGLFARGTASGVVYLMRSGQVGGGRLGRPGVGKV